MKFGLAGLSSPRRGSGVTTPVAGSRPVTMLILKSVAPELVHQPVAGGRPGGRGRARGGVHVGQRHHQRHVEHEAGGGHRLGEGSPLLDEREHRAREALLDALEHLPLVLAVDVRAVEAQLLVEVGDVELGLLEGALPELEHLLRNWGSPIQASISPRRAARLSPTAASSSPASGSPVRMSFTFDAADAGDMFSKGGGGRGSDGWVPGPAPGLVGVGSSTPMTLPPRSPQPASASAGKATT